MINTITAGEEILKLRKQDLKETDFELKHLPVEMQTEISTFRRDNYEVFSTRYKTLGMKDAIIPDIKLSHNYPIQLKSYPLPKILIEVADKEIAELLEAGIFKNVTSSSYTFPMILIKKKGTDRYRLAIDFRLLNNITELFKISVPRIKDIIQDISGFKYYATIDLKAAFLQICLPPSMQELCTVITHKGNVKCTRMPFGLKNSSQCFVCLMNRVMEGLHDQGIKFYVDDIILAANTHLELKQKMQIVFNRLKQHNLTVDPKKMQLFQEYIIKSSRI